MAATSSTLRTDARAARLTRWAALRAALDRVPGDLLLALFRLAVTGVFLPAGLIKARSWESTVALFAEEYRVPVLAPAVAAAMATTFELGCSSLLALGLATRLATLPLLGMIVTIQLFVYPHAWSEHLVWGSLLVTLLARGPGAVSLDRLIGLERDRW